jgi:hypothetical protein
MTIEEVVVERPPRSSARPSATSFYIWVTDEDDVDHLILAEALEKEDGRTQDAGAGPL